MSAAEVLQPAVALRSGGPSDAGFIFDSWLNSFRDYNPEAREVPKRIYFEMHRALLRELLERANVVVACGRETPEVILGWAAFEADSLHYLYVKSLYRGFDVTALLLEAVPSSCRWFTHRTPKLQRVAAQRGLTFNPYLAGVVP
jgi:hypothetical protein